MDLELQEMVKNYDFIQNEGFIGFMPMENQGLSAKTYLVHTVDNTYVVKKYKYNNVSKKLEYKIQSLAYRKAVSPKPILLDIENLIFISRYQPGCHKKSLNICDLKRLVKTLRDLHSIKIVSKPFDFKFFFKTHAKKMDNRLKLALLKLDEFQKDLVLCHNDLNSQNIIFSDSVQFIDWEYAYLNDRYFDLAAISVEFSLNKQYEYLFLKLYFRGAKMEWKKFKLYKFLYGCLCKVWNDLYA